MKWRALSLAVCLFAAPAHAAPEGPNVVIFLADDLGWADVGFHGEESIQTPSLDLTSYLFRISEDPHERNNLAAERPDVVARLADAIHAWRMRHPVAGTRHELVPPPGWRAPRDWASYPVPLEALQDEPAPGMAPGYAIRALDWQHGEAGRLIYDCEPFGFLGGGLCK